MGSGGEVDGICVCARVCVRVCVCVPGRGATIRRETLFIYVTIRRETFIFFVRWEVCVGGGGGFCWVARSFCVGSSR